MYDLGKELASEAHNHTPVYLHSSEFAPDVALVNFYPVSSCPSILQMMQGLGFRV